jgi:hypothetical protein
MESMLAVQLALLSLFRIEGPDKVTYFIYSMHICKEECVSVCLMFTYFHTT